MNKPSSAFLLAFIPGEPQPKGIMIHHIMLQSRYIRDQVVYAGLYMIGYGGTGQHILKSLAIEGGISRARKIQINVTLPSKLTCVHFCFHMNFPLLNFLVRNSKRWQFQNNNFSNSKLLSYITLVIYIQYFPT